MASENPEPPSPPNNKEASNQPAKKRSQTQKRLTAAQKERDRRRAMIEQCHVQSLLGLDIILQDGVTKTTFTNYIGEHQSQIFYGGFDIQRPNKPNIHIALGQPTPIDLGNSDSGPAVCLAVPTYIFRRFPSSEKPVSSVSSSDSKNPPSPLSSIFPNCTPKNGLCLVTFKIYFPIHFMASANKISSRVRCGKEANLRYTPRFNEFVEYYNEPRKNASISRLNQNRLSMEINEFVGRILLSHQNLNLLREHSMKLPDFSVFSKTERNTAEALSSPDVIPTFLVLPLRTYIRVAALNNRLNFGWKSLPPWFMGIPMRLTKTASVQKDPSDNTMNWIEWTGVKDALTLAPDVVSKIISCDRSLEVRIVFIRRTSGDCGKVISQVIRECQFEPARIRRTNSKDSEDYKFLKMKQLVLTDKVKEFIGADSGSISRKSLKFQEVWSRDIDSNPYILGLNAKALSSIRSVKPTINELFGDLGTKITTVNGIDGNTNTNTTNNDAPQSNGEGQQQQEPQTYQRPSRPHVPPQRLQMADSDLLRAIHKRTHSEAEILRIGQQTAGPEVEHINSNVRPRPSSPSATSDSALSTKLPRKSGGKRKQSDEQPSSDNKSNNKRRKVDDEKSVVVALAAIQKSGDYKSKSGLSAWAYINQKESIKITAKISNSTRVILEANDPYALPSSPVDTNINSDSSSNHRLSVPPKKGERSPSPEPPILVEKEEVNWERIPSPVLNIHRDNEASDTTASSPPPTLSMYSSNVEQSVTNREKANSTNSNSHSVSNCPSNGLPPYVLSRPSSLQPHLLQPIPSTSVNFPSQRIVVSSSLPFQMVSAGVLGHSNSISQPATMWTLRETPLPAPDNNINPSEGIPRLFNSSVAFPMAFLAPGSIVPIPTPTLITPNIALTTQSSQLLMNAFNTSFTPEMAAFLNYYASFISATGLLNPGQSPNNGQSPMSLHSNPLSMTLPHPPTVANTTPWNSSNQQRGGLL
ncbi:unnamed protein product [Hymenolepis diminuta]|uniref:BHLH domain-containing protein n=1 Tax=Hymenolepis diminuta TaxID=6216 RepID=A0A158QEM9_HYMDI|nr:unnamed protein product [Hymenolepis diminuta]